MLEQARPSRVFLATFVIPTILVPLAGYIWMRRTSSFLEMSVGTKPTHFSEIGAWISVAVGSTLLYGLPALLIFVLVRRREPKHRNSAILLTLLAYLVGLGVWLEVHGA